MKRLTFLLFMVLGILSGCYYEVAKPPKIQHVHIASDVLTSSDSVLFNSLKKFKRIRVHIHHLSIDSLEELLSEEGIATQIDMVFFTSIEEGLKFEKKGRLQTILQEEKLPRRLIKHFSISKKLMGIGYNPYVVKQKRSDSTQTLTYADLGLKKKWQSCERNHLSPFLVGVQSGYRRQNATLFSAWVERFINQQSSGIDSISNSTVSFGRFTDCTASLVQSERIQFPNQQLKGCYSDMVVAGIVRQARNYSAALEVLNTLDYLLFLTALNKSFNTFPASSNSINYKGQSVLMYPISPIRLTPYYATCRKVLEKKKKKKANL
jgi:hypothetical protein